jgi:hypothetical protein
VMVADGMDPLGQKGVPARRGHGLGDIRAGVMGENGVGTVHASPAGPDAKRG